MASPEPWTSPSDLAEQTFCPRAYRFRRSGPSPPTASADAGVRYHARRLGAERWRAEHPGLPWVAVVVGLSLLALAVGWVIR
ncbi:MAG TPA: hypothetical protein VMH49_05180 [Thermoplasmata archaeon]|nr:hypothetical protein [Thermoplasmata archaeon]